MAACLRHGGWAMPTLPGSSYSSHDQWATDLTGRASQIRAKVESETRNARPDAPADARSAGIDAGGRYLFEQGLAKSLVDGGLNLASAVLATFFDAITAFRNEQAGNFADANAAILNDYLGTSLTKDQLAPAGSGSERQQ